MIKKISVPFCGVALGCAALGNLLQSYSEGVRYACGILSAIFLVLYLIKVISTPSSLKEDAQNPIMTTVAGTFSMAIMLLSGYLKPFIGKAAFVIWIIAIVLHAVLIVYVTVKYIVKLDIKKIFASYYIVYVGIVVASVTAPIYGAETFGSIAFWFGLICFALLLILVTYRYVKYKEIPDPAKPLFCIYAAPMSLCIAGYVQSVTPKSKGFLIGMFIIASIIYVMALVKAIGYLGLPFFPSYAAFTFPFVISAIASKMTMACLSNLGCAVAWLKYVVLVETIIATLLVLYTYIRFVIHLFKK